MKKTISMSRYSKVQRDLIEARKLLNLALDDVLALAMGVDNGNLQVRRNIVKNNMDRLMRFRGRAG